MESQATDPYELKLYQMFQSCDSQKNGLLDEEALNRLCGLLELQDKGSILISNLASNVKSASSSVRGQQLQVSFEHFKEALLNFLGTQLDEMRDSSTSNNALPTNNNSGLFDRTSDGEEREEYFVTPPSTILSPSIVKECVLVIKDEDANLKNAVKAEDENVSKEHEHSDREVAPKLVKCGKKYGRRSKPAYKTEEVANITSLQIISSDSDDSSCKVQSSHRFCPLDGSGHHRNHQHSSSNCCQNVQRSVSHTDILQKRRHSNGVGVLTSNGSRLKRCASLPPQRNRNREHVIQTERKGTKDDDGLVVEQRGVELDPLSKQQTHSFDSYSSSVVETMHSDNILHIWEQAQIPNGRDILFSLGFEDQVVNLSQLHKAIEEEFRGINEPHQLVLMRASLLLQSTELNTLRQVARQFYDENCKLRADNKDANRRIALFTAEIDERHASLEDATRKEINQLEQKHAAVVRDLTAQMNNDREIWSNVNGRLKQRIKILEEEEAKINARCDSLHLEAIQNDAERQKHLQEISDLLAKNNALSTELSQLKLSTMPTSIDNQTNKSAPESLVVVDQQSTIVTEEIVEVMELKKKLAKYTQENSDLRDKTDELLNEIETLNYELSKLQHSKDKVKNPDLSELNNDESMESGSDQKTKNDCCKDLEASLEQMKKAYEDCEEYWYQKLKEERSMFEKERQLFEDEQRDADNKFSELMEKIGEYEEQFKKDGRLSPIEERDFLEQQFVQMECETEELRKNTTILLDEKAKEIADLQEQIVNLQKRLQEANEVNSMAGGISTNGGGEEATETSSPSSQHPPLILRLDASSLANAKQNLPEENGELVMCKEEEEEEGSPITATDHLLPTPTKTVLQSDLGDVADCESASSVDSGRSFETHSVHSLQTEVRQPRSAAEGNPGSENDGACKCSSPNCLSVGSNRSVPAIKEEIARLKLFEMSLRDQINSLLVQRDNLVVELQQLQDAKPVLSKAYARTAHPSQIQRINQLEQKNRHLQNVVKQQQQYNESIMQQSWRQHQVELNELHARLEAQGALIAEQVQRLQNADIFVKDLYVENSHLTGEVQRLERQCLRANLMQQQQQQQQQQHHHYQQSRQSCSGLPGMP